MAEPSWTIRPLGPADAAEALDVIHAAFRAQPVATDPPSAALAEDAASIAAQIAAGGGACAVAAEGMVAALLWKAQGGDALYLGRLGVRPGWRRRGLARALVATAEAEARRRGLARLTCGVRLVLEDNRRLFEGCGFVETGRTCHPGYAEPTSATLEKRLGETRPG
jgi:GNAT superfamily N-acetyltransferase